MSDGNDAATGDVSGRLRQQLEENRHRLEALRIQRKRGTSSCGSSANSSFAAASAMVSSLPAPAATVPAPPAVRQQEQRLQRELVLGWQCEAHSALVAAEAAERVALLLSFFHAPIVAAHWRRLGALECVEARDIALSAAAAAHVAESMRECNGAADNGDVQAEGAYAREQAAAVCALRQLNRDRDYAEEKLREALSAAEERARDAEAETRRERAGATALRAQLDTLHEQAVAREEQAVARAAELLSLKDVVARGEDERRQLLRDLREAEAEIHRLCQAAATAAGAHEARQLEILEACKEGEGRAVAALAEENRAMRAQLHAELDRARRQKARYRREHAAMSSVFDECLGARAALQSELLELQGLKDDAAARVHAAVARAREETLEANLQLQRRVTELSRLVASKDALLAALVAEGREARGTAAAAAGSAWQQHAPAESPSPAPPQCH